MKSLATLYALALTLQCICSSLVLAQEGAVQIWTPQAAGERPIRLSSMSIKAKTYGFLASTRIELEFENPNSRVMEGEFVFPLTPAQTVVGYALEVNGVLREGVVVPKQTARVAFEEITRRGVDPGLAELTRGNVFRTRIYPIPARGRKRIAITIEQALQRVNGNWSYRLPVPVTGKLDRYSVRVEAVAAPVTSTTGLTLSDAKIAERTQLNVQPEAMIALDLPADRAARVFSTPARDLKDPFQYVVAQIDAPSWTPNRGVVPKSIAVYLDASRSGLQRDHQKEAQFLRALFAEYGDAKIQLIAFRDQAAPVQNFQLKAGNSSDFFTALKAIDYDGGTALQALAFGEAVDLAIVLTDGSATFEPFKIPVRTPRARKYVIGVATGTPDAEGIARLAERLNANTLDLSSGSVAEAVKATRAARIGVRASTPAGACVDVTAISKVVAGAATLAARCKAGTKITLSWSDGTQSETRSITTPSKATIVGELAVPIQRLWASTQIRALNLSGNVGAGDALSQNTLALATQFGVVTAQTSLLVLDSIEDYLRYDVAPIEPELRAQFDARRVAKISDSASTPNLESLISQWQEFKSWHATPHTWLSGVLPAIAARNEHQWRASGNSAQQKRAAVMLERAQLLQAQGDKPSNEASARKLMQELSAADEAYLKSLSADTRAIVMNARGQAKQWSALGANSGGETSAASAGAPPNAVMPSAPRPARAQAESTAESAGAPMRDNSAASESSQALDSVEVTGARIRRSDMETAMPDAREQSQLSNTKATLELKAYTPNAPYLARIRAASNPYATYLSEADRDGSVGFYLDCADYFYSEGNDKMLALRVLSNISEVQIENVGAIRVLAEKLRQWQQWDVALAQFELAQSLRTEEPQGYRDFALSLARAPAQSGGDVKRALELLWYVASHDWDSRFASIQLTSLHEFNDLLMRASKAQRPDLKKLSVPGALIGAVPVGLRVVMGWNANDVDIDLWVLDPAGEWAYYSQPQTRSGGQMSDDFTEGYGPETFTIARPLPGTYTVYANYYANHEQKLAAPISVYLEFQTPFGQGKAKTTATVRRLEDDKEVIEIGRFTVQ